MASYSMHLAIAKLHLKNHSQKNIDEEELIKGTLEPDMVPSSEKGRTHYGKHSAWSNPAKYLQENGRSIENSRKRGYFLHLVTDYLFYHKLIDIDKLIAKWGLDEWGKNQRNDFSILEGEIEDKYNIHDYIAKLPESIKKEMTRAEGELKVFERKSLFKFLEDIAQIDLDKLADILLQNPDADLIKLFEELSLQ
ncbi:MAG: hypothetical protein IJK18_08780 [Clostridia bacterium]|nr:hypothetical protein [Clostridia bacterium]